MNHAHISDVFLTSTPAAIEMAVRVEYALTSAGLTIFNPLHMTAPGKMGDRLREELGASLCLVAVLGAQIFLPGNIAVEIGAAMAWKKPIYAVVDDAALVRTGALPSDVQIVTIGQLNRIVTKLRGMSQPLTAEQRQVLADVYADVNVPTDQLPRSPEALSRFTDRFNKVTGHRWSSERLLREVFVMRKSGRLPKLRRTRGLSPRAISA